MTIGRGRRGPPPARCAGRGWARCSRSGGGRMSYPLISALLAMATILLALRGSRGAAIGLIIAICVFWPEYMRIPIGPAQMSIPRLTAIALILNAMRTRDIPRPHALDYLVLAFWTWGTLCTILNDNVAGPLTGRIGMFMDTVCVYMAARICVRTGDDVAAMARWLCLAGMFAGVIGMTEATTGRAPYRHLISLVVMDSPFFQNYVGPDIAHEFPVIEYRMGFLRSYGSTLVHITWGTINLVVLGLMYPVVREAIPQGRLTPLVILGMVGAGLGLFSSMSAGPWAAAFILIGLLAVERWSILLVPVGIFFVLIMALVGLAFEQPPWYPLLRVIGLDANTAWYRSQLISFIFTKWEEYGFMGTKAEVFDQWAMEIDGRPFLDVANHYLMVGLNSGILGIVLQVLMFTTVIGHLANQYRYGNPRTRLFSYSVMALIISFAINAISVTYSDLMSVLLYLLCGVGMMGETPEEGMARAEAPVRVASPVRGLAYNVDVWS